MSASKTRGHVGASIILAILGLTAASGNENTTSPPAAQPTDTPTTPGTPTPSPTPSGTPSMDCPDTIAAVTFYRLATFYLPPIWGFFSLRWLERNRYL